MVPTCTYEPEPLNALASEFKMCSAVAPNHPCSRTPQRSTPCVSLHPSPGCVFTELACHGEQLFCKWSTGVACIARAIFI
jgi:hypothetical protein